MTVLTILEDQRAVTGGSRYYYGNLQISHKGKSKFFSIGLDLKCETIKVSDDGDIEESEEWHSMDFNFEADEVKAFYLELKKYFEDSENT